jgi:hypothetical protein
MKKFKDFLEEATTIDLDMIKDPKLNKKAWNILKKKQKAYYSAEDNEVLSAADVKKDVGSVSDLFKFTDYVTVTAVGKAV